MPTTNHCSSTCESNDTHKRCTCGAKQALKQQKSQAKKSSDDTGTLSMTRNMQTLRLFDGQATELDLSSVSSAAASSDLRDMLRQEITKRVEAEQALEAAVRDLQQALAVNRGLEQTNQELTALQAAASLERNEMMDRLTSEVAKRVEAEQAKSLAFEQALEAAVRDLQQALAVNRGLEQTMQELTALQAAASLERNGMMDRLAQEIGKRVEAEQALAAAVRDSVAPAATQSWGVWKVGPGVVLEIKHKKGYVRFYSLEDPTIITNSDNRLHFGIKVGDVQRYGSDELAARAFCEYFKSRLLELARLEQPPANGSCVAAALRRLSDRRTWKNTIATPFRVTTSRA